jgi:hypothetical protein
MKKISNNNTESAVKCDVWCDCGIYSFGQKYQNRKAYEVLVLKPEGRKLFGRTKIKWTDRS